ncbi:uncharacterized protein LOC131941184 [Physella acuta]|uniref:uncharacterized protein LOC131941184 n=1 Tax=Physella acuta TaxID=109671 RepID=UPI0027DD3FC4|nr:uncharacterized protein LOC131941184 [Physella acuta]
MVVLSEFFIHTLTLIIMSSVIAVCLLLAVTRVFVTMWWPLYTLFDKSYTILICLAGIMLSLHVLPMYLTKYPIWKFFHPAYVDPHLQDIACFAQLAIFHLGLGLFLTVLLIETYKLSYRESQIQFPEANTCIWLPSVFICVCMVMEALYLSTWFLLYPHDTKYCMTSRHQDYLFIIENVLIMLSLFLVTSAYATNHTCDTIVDYLALTVGLYGGVALYFARICLEGKYSAAVDALLAEIHSFLYVFILIIGNIYLSFQTKKNLQRISLLIPFREQLPQPELILSESSLYEGGTTPFLDTNGTTSTLSFFQESDHDYIFRERRTSFLSQPRRIGRRSDVPSLGNNPDQTAPVVY